MNIDLTIIIEMEMHKTENCQNLTPGNIMGLFRNTDKPKLRDRHLYKAMETSDKERAKKEKKAKSNNQN